jgi:putative glutamine amidotransferase
VEDAAAYLTALAPDAVLLSGGNDIGAAPQRDRVEHAALDYAAARRLPVLGVCRGLQMINHHQGGRLRKVDGHVAIRHRVTGLLESEGREVNSYHGLGLRTEDLGRDLEVAATSDDGLVEALRHRHLPWLALMWHPEREEQLCPKDLALILNHLRG